MYSNNTSVARSVTRFLSTRNLKFCFTNYYVGIFVCNTFSNTFQKQNINFLKFFGYGTESKIPCTFILFCKSSYKMPFRKRFKSDFILNKLHEGLLAL